MARHGDDGDMSAADTLFRSYGAGSVETVGRNVTQFRAGDHVFGELPRCGFGAYAEFAVAPEKALALKPAILSFEEAAAMPAERVPGRDGYTIADGCAGNRP